MNILITGGGGFLGSHLVESQLAQGHRVTSIDLHHERLEHLRDAANLTAVQGDIRNAGQVRPLLKGVDVAYHLASAHLDVSLGAEMYHQVNIEATKQLIELAADAHVGRFVHCSSVGVIGDVPNPPADEETPCRPTNIYGQTKLAGEQAIRSFAAKTGYPTIVARPAWIYGPRCPRTRKLFRLVRKGRFVFFGKGDNLRHPIYVKDAVAGLECCANASPMQGELYIIAGEQPMRLNAMVQTIAEVLGQPVKTIHLPMALGQVTGASLELGFRVLNRQPPFSRRSLDFFQHDNAYRIDKARRELGFAPQFTFKSGIEHMLAKEM